jgi:hypothetical protein
VGNTICPDYSERTGECTQAASITFLFIKNSHIPISVQGACEADRSAASLLALMTKDWNGCQVFYIMHIDATLTSVLHLAGRLTGATADAPVDININRHFVPPGYPSD